MDKGKFGEGEPTDKVLPVCLALANFVKHGIINNTTPLFPVQ